MASTCPNLLVNGNCDDNACTFAHTILTCELCSFVFQSANEYNHHLESDNHRSKILGQTVVYYCPICNANVPTHKGWEQHIKGRIHQQKADDAGVASVDVAPQPAISTASATACDLCQAVIPNRFWKEHLNKEDHKLREQYSRYMTVVEQSETDKNGVVVEGLFDFEFIDPPEAKIGKVLTATIKALKPSSKITLLEAKLASAQGKSSGGSPFYARISDGPNLPLTLHVGFKQPYVGRYQDRLELLFKDKKLKKKFIITRSLKAIVGNKGEYEALKPKTPYIPRSFSSKRSPIHEVVEGIKPPAASVIPYVSRLPKSHIPAPLEKLLTSKGSVAKVTARIKSVFIPQAFNSKSHGQHFKHLLWIEEFRMAKDLQRYDMTSTLNKRKEFYYLTIPGLSEKRPSVLVGDSILVQEQGTTTVGRWFEGYVHIVRESEVALRFHESFKVYAPGLQFYVRFKLNRIPIQREHQAMDAVFTEDRVLFPVVKHLPSGGPPSVSKSTLKVYNTLISSNEPQLQAVVSVVAQRPGSLPFVIFGPPGTGKTITVIECIRQLLAKDPQAKVLACAPGNSAADLLAIRLRGHLSTDELFRFYAPSRFKEQVPNDLLPYTFTQAGDQFNVPMDRLKKFKVIVSTCGSSGVFSGVGMARGHFTHIFIDEAGQATEPESFLSIKMLADNRTNVILSGDPKQLGPVIQSGIAKELGLEKSYLERLMDRDVYDIKTGRGRSVVKLVKNFRSHKAIIQIPNEKFYRGDLVPCGDPTIINSFLKSPCLPSKKFPVIFHGVSGKDDREASSPSFFNIEEVLQVKYYVQKLKKDRKFKTTDKDIGIIAPYHAQCLKLRKALKDIGKDVKIGSVEEFQGQERKVIIISTVRSSKDLVKFDLQHTLGFVANPRRFNVAVTRAQAMLIIVGDSQVLSLDPLWRSFLNYVYLNGGWTGPDITWDPEAEVDETGGYDKQASDTAQFDMIEFTHRMEALTMDEVDDE